MPQDPNLLFKNDQIKSFRRIDPASVQFDDITLSADMKFLDMVMIDGAVPDGTKPVAGLIEDTAGQKNGDKGPGLIQRAILAVTADGALVAGETVYPTTAVKVKKVPIEVIDATTNALERRLQCGYVLRGGADASTCVIMFQAFGGAGNDA